MTRERISLTEIIRLLDRVKMVYTDDDYLPSPKELDVPQELEMGSAPMRAAAHHMGKYCDEQSKEFMLCRYEENDPRYCLNEGKAVTACGVKFVGLLKKHCYEEFTKYWQCIDHKGQGKYTLNNCRAEQVVYDNCVLKHLGQERVHYGYFGKVRLHETCRPKPQDHPIKHAPFPDEPPTEFPCEDIKAVKAHYEGELWNKTIKPLIEEATKDMPKEQLPLWYNKPWAKRFTAGDVYYNSGNDSRQETKPKRIFSSDFGLS